MTQTLKLLGYKPAYSDQQLLLHTDFIDEQSFLLDARYRQNLGLLGWGVARGLEVSRHSETLLSVSPGYAVDSRGHDIELRTAELVDVRGAGAGLTVTLTLRYRSERATHGEAPDNRISCYAVLDLGVPEPHDIVLAMVALDDHGHIRADTLSARKRTHMHARPASVTAASLAPALQRGWVTFAFHPSRIPEDEKDTRPPFRVGPTRVLAHRKYQGEDNSKGAGGTMSLALPPGIRTIHRFRIAGDANAGTLTVALLKGGITRTDTRRDGKRKGDSDEFVYAHKVTPLCTLTIKRSDSAKDEGSYLATETIASDLGAFNDPLHTDYPNDTLSVDVRSTDYASVSLVAVEVSY